MEALQAVVGKQVIVESVYHREVHGILSSVDELGISIDKEIFIPIRYVYRVTLKERFERDKEKEKKGKEKKDTKILGLSDLPTF